MTMTYAKQDLKLGSDADLNKIARIATEHVEAFNHRHDPAGYEPPLSYIDALIGRRQRAPRPDAPHVIVWIEEATEATILEGYDMIEQARNVIASTITARYNCTVDVRVEVSSNPS